MLVAIVLAAVIAVEIAVVLWMEHRRVKRIIARRLERFVTGSWG